MFKFTLSLILLLCFCANVFAQSGKPVLIEYYDYECPHCRKMNIVVNQLKHTYPNLRVIYRVTPVLNPTSKRVAKLVLAAKRQRHWQALHDAVMSVQVMPSVALVLELAEQLGLNNKKLLRDSENQEFKNLLQENISLAWQHSADGQLALPIFVLGNSSNSKASAILTGEQSSYRLSQLINDIT